MNFNRLSRRDLLKLMLVAPPAYFCHKLGRHLNAQLVVPGGLSEQKNIIILLLDTLSAINTSLDGYHRATTPDLARFAERATVYHAHYSAGNFTVPGTASLLTGLYPWSHRANQYAGKVVDAFVDHNIFNLVGSDFNKLGYSQNPYADTLLYQFNNDIDFHIRSSSLNLMDNSLYDSLFSHDAFLAYQGVEKFSLRHDSGIPGAQLLSFLNNYRIILQKQRIANQYGNEYPLGLPYVLGDVGGAYNLKDLFFGIQSIMAGLSIPFVAYFHLFPPHAPYLPSREFVDMFVDGWIPPDKPMGVFPEVLPRVEILCRLQRYDEFIAATDAHFGELLAFFEANGFFDNSYIFITSDHGELFERGIYGHTNEYLYEPIIRVPLLVSTPGQAGRVDIYNPTSSTDVLPTVLAILGQELPGSLEGRPLPGFSGLLDPDPDRAIFSFVSKSTPAKGRLGAYTVAMRRGDFKLIKYFGYRYIPETYELYDLKSDPEERHDLYRVEPAVSEMMRNILNAKVEQINS